MKALFDLERTTPPKVWNKYHKSVPPNAIYIGRGSPYGNPFPISETCTREESIAKFREYLDSNEQLKVLIRRELRGKDLVCFCKPKACHGDYIFEIANF